MDEEYREITPPKNAYPMVELSNGDIVQFMAYADSEHEQEVWRVFNDHAKKYLHLKEFDTWATREGDVLPGIYMIKEME